MLVFICLEERFKESVSVFNIQDLKILLNTENAFSRSPFRSKNTFIKTGFKKASKQTREECGMTTFGENWNVV